MEQTNKKSTASVIAAISFFILAIFQVAWMIRLIMYNIRHFDMHGEYVYPLTTWIGYVFRIALFVFIGIILLARKRNILLLAGISALTINQIVGFVRGFWNWSYRIESYYRGEPKFNFFAMLPQFFQTIGFILVLAMIVVCMFNLSEQIKGIFVKLWFVPGILHALEMFFAWLLILILRIGCIGYWYGMHSYIRFANILYVIISIVSVLMLCRWIAYPNGKEKQQSAETTYGTTSYVSDSTTEKDGYISIVIHVLLLFFVGGIWQYIWIYRTTEYLNRVKGEPYRNPTTKLLLSIFVPFYSIYWVYVSAQRIDKLAKEKGIQSDIALLCLILQFVIPIVSLIIMQDKINTIETKKNDGTQAQPTAETVTKPVEAQEKANDLNSDIPELLKKYKELLDSGIITEEEYEAKKKQLLGL